MQKPGKKKLIQAYEKMVRIRRVEEKLMEVFSNGEIPGFIHVCIGQEATPVAVCSHLKDSDYISATHRGHGHALAKGIDITIFMAELFGKKSESFIRLSSRLLFKNNCLCLVIRKHILIIMQ